MAELDLRQRILRLLARLFGVEFFGVADLQAPGLARLGAILRDPTAAAAPQSKAEALQRVVEEDRVGVRVYLNGLEVPDEFVLLLSGDGPAKGGRYKVVWRQGDEVGAKYVS